MLRKIASILMITVLMAQLSSKLFMEVHFMLNQEEIIEAFCVNKDKEELQCNGKCYLAEQLKKVDYSDSKDPESNTSDSNSNNKRNTALDYVESFQVGWNLTFPKFEKENIREIVSFYDFSNVSAIFHPPQFI